jgi:hypothetical protein
MGRKMTLAGLSTSLDITNSVHTLLKVLDARHPNDPDLTMARRMFLEFNVKLGDKHSEAEARVTVPGGGDEAEG